MNEVPAMEVLYPPCTIDKLPLYQLVYIILDKFTYQLHTLRIVPFDILCDISVYHPLRDHSEPRVRCIVQATDPDKSQYVRVVQ